MANRRGAISDRGKPPALARERQALLDESFKAKLVGETVPTLNRRLMASREETLLASERVLQQTAIRLSLYLLRLAPGIPLCPKSEWLLPGYAELTPEPPSTAATPNGCDGLPWRSALWELVQFQLEKERRAVELKLATNQLSPALNAYAQVAQDAGLAKKTFTGQGPSRHRPDERGGRGDIRDAAFCRSRNARTASTATARAQLAQLLCPASDTPATRCTSQVQDSVSELVQAHRRVEKAREELKNTHCAC